MQRSCFSRLYADIRKAWNIKDGLIVRLASPDGLQLRMCISPEVNDGLMAEKCRIWKDSSILYEGPIDSDEVRNILTANKICKGELTVSRYLESASGRKSRCYGNAEDCRCRSCRAGKGKKE